MVVSQDCRVDHCYADHVSAVTSTQRFFIQLVQRAQILALIDKSLESGEPNVNVAFLTALAAIASEG
jgi:hypothetical protein